jgi:hypothetical protein
MMASATLALGCGEEQSIRGCNIGGNTPAAQSGITVDVALPKHCHFTVEQARSPVDLEISFFAPSNWYLDRPTLHGIFARDASGFQQLGNLFQFNWQPDGCGERRRAC